MTSLVDDNDAGLAGILAKLDWANTTEPLTVGYAVIGLTNFGARPVEITRLAEVLDLPVSEAGVRVRQWGRLARNGGRGRAHHRQPRAREIGSPASAPDR